MVLSMEDQIKLKMVALCSELNGALAKHFTPTADILAQACSLFNSHRQLAITDVIADVI